MTALRKVDIVVPIWNRLKETRRCLEAVLAFTEEPYRLILIDNGSDRATQEYLEAFERSSKVPVLRLRNERNVGFIQAANQGIRSAAAEWVLILNNDTVVTSGWLTEMLQVALSHPSIGLINPTSNSLGFLPGKATLEAFAAGLKAHSGTWTELSTALGFCLLGRRCLFHRVGLFDEGYGMGYFEDDDLSRRVKAAGYRCGRACAAYVWHEERASFRLIPRGRRAFEANRRRFEARWGRRIRVLSEGPLPESIALPLLDQGHWLYFLSSKERLSPKVFSHAQVACLNCGGSGWRRRALFKVLLKRRKPFDLVIAQDPDWARWLRSLRFFHRAKVLSPFSAEEILKECQILSQPL